MNNKQFLKKLEKSIKEYFGDRCSDDHMHCPVCKAWSVFNTLEDCIEEEEK